MSGFLCSMVGASFTVAAVAQVLRSKKAITAIGNAQIDTAQSQFGGASALFDGVNDYLAVTTSEIFTGDFTMEMWIRPSAVNMQYQTLIQVGTETTGRYVWHVYYDGLFVNLYGSGTYDIFTSGVNLTANTWAHVAVVRNGSTVTIYVNGTSRGTNTAGVTNYGNTGGYYIAASDTSAQDFGGHMDEIRISNIARYTANFTAPTAAFVNDSNTLLLIHANGTDAQTFFEDDNGVRSAIGLTAIGDAKVSTAQSKFGGASLLLDGTGDYLYSTSPLSLGTGDWTVECWIRTGTANRVFFDNRIPTSSAGVFFLNVSGFPAYYDNTTSSIAGTTNCADTTWRHIAYSKSGTTLRIFVNGTVDATYTGYSSDMGTGRSFVVGAQFDGGIPLVGNMDEVRISNSARYTAAFTAPTAPFVNDSNTLLLMHCDGTDASTVFVDDNGGYQNVPPTAAFVDDPFTQLLLHFNNAITDDNSSTRTAVTGLSVTGHTYSTTAKYGSHSLASAGIPGGWRCSSTTLLDPGTNDFTIEFYFRPPGTANTDQITFGNSGNTGNLQFFINCDTGFIGFGRTNIAWDAQTTQGAFTADVWYHVAAVKTAGLLKLYLNGTQVASAANTQSYTCTTQYLCDFGGNTGDPLMIDEFRISRIARYTATFTVA